MARRDQRASHWHTGEAYVGIVLDLYSPMVVALAISAVNDRHLTIRALDIPLECRRPEVGLVIIRTRARTTRAKTTPAVIAAHGILAAWAVAAAAATTPRWRLLLLEPQGEVGERSTATDVKAEVCDYIELFCNRRRHSAPSHEPAAFASSGGPQRPAKPEATSHNEPL